MHVKCKVYSIQIWTVYKYAHKKTYTYNSYPAYAFLNNFFPTVFDCRRHTRTLHSSSNSNTPLGVAAHSAAGEMALQQLGRSPGMTCIVENHGKSVTASYWSAQANDFSLKSLWARNPWNAFKIESTQVALDSACPSGCCNYSINISRFLSQCFYHYLQHGTKEYQRQT